MSEVECVLCGGSGPNLYVGLAVIGIKYPGAVKDICGSCLAAITLWVTHLEPQVKTK